MPVAVSAVYRSFGVPPAEHLPVPEPIPGSNAVPDPLSPAYCTQRGYRFTGYHLHHDGDENIIKDYPYDYQPLWWSKRAIWVANNVMRSP